MSTNLKLIPKVHVVDIDIDMHTLVIDINCTSCMHSLCIPTFYNNIKLKLHFFFVYVCIPFTTGTHDLYVCTKVLSMMHICYMYIPLVPLPLSYSG